MGGTDNEPRRSTSFLILFGLFVLTLEVGEVDRVNVWEWGFIVYVSH